MSRRGHLFYSAGINTRVEERTEFVLLGFGIKSRFSVAEKSRDSLSGTESVSSGLLVDDS